MAGGTKHRQHRHSEAVIRSRIAHWQGRLDALLADRPAVAPKAPAAPSLRQIRVEHRRARLARLAAHVAEARP